MENIFQNPRLGDKFVLDKPFDEEVPYIVYLGKREILFGESAGECVYDFAGQTLDGEYTEIITDLDGNGLDAAINRKVISKWEDPIDEAELEKRAEEYATHRPYDDRWSEWQTCKNGYMAGYREAKNGK